MNVLIFIEKVTFDWPRRRYLALILAIMLVKTGIWHIPNLANSRQIALNPFTVPAGDPLGQYLVTSWLAPFLAWLIGATSEGEFLLLYLAFSAAFTALFIFAAFRRLPEREARIATAIFAMLPVSATAYFWLGNDSLTLLLMLSALLLKQRPAVALVGGLLGLQHFEQAIWAFMALTAASLAATRVTAQPTYPWRMGAITLTGILAGKFALMLTFHFAEMSVESRLSWLIAHRWEVVSQFWYHGQYALWSVLGPGWLIAIRYADRRQAAIPFFVGLGLALPLLLISEDQTRVLAITTFPIVFIFWLGDRPFLEGLSRKEIAAFLAVWIIVPWAWVWRGEPMWSVLPYDLAYAANKLLGWFNLPEGAVAEWPFMRH